ncbi:MAG TPA: cytochrome c-type biogenesis protein [Casimicrobiaceae bacterium]
MIRVLLAALWLTATPAFADDALDARLKSLEAQLRCLVCQNQTLAESEAPLAADLRNEVRELAQSGKSDDDIRAYLVARYGDFVLYKPPVKPVTYLLWFGPFVLLAAGLVVWLLVLRQRGRMEPHESDDLGSPASVDIARARELLDD